MKDEIKVNLVVMHVTNLFHNNTKTRYHHSSDITKQLTG